MNSSHSCMKIDLGKMHLSYIMRKRGYNVTSLKYFTWIKRICLYFLDILYVLALLSMWFQGLHFN